MNGEHELRQLAHLLRAGAETARQIATIRTSDATEIHSLVRQAESMAEALDRIAERGENRAN